MCPFYICHKRLPFNWKTPLGYSIALCLQAIGTYCTSANGVSIVCSMIGCCWLLKTFVEDITKDLANLEANDIFRGSIGQSEIKGRFNSEVKYFTMVKQLSVSELRLIHAFSYKVVMIKRGFNCDFFIKSDRLVEEFNTNFQILITGIYVWIRLTVWSSIITLIYQLVEYYFETNCMNMYCQGASFPKEIGALEMIDIHLILICLWEWKFSFGVIDKVTLVVLSSSLRCDLPRFKWWLILNLNWNFFFTFSRPTTIPYQSSWFER